MYWSSFSRTCAPTSRAPRVLTDIHNRIAQLENMPRGHRFPDQNVIGDPTVDSKLDVRGQKIANRYNKPAVRPIPNKTHNPTSELPSIKKQKLPAGPEANGLSAVQLPQVSYPHKSMKKDQNTNTPVIADRPKKTKTNKLSLKNDEATMKKPNRLEPLPRVSSICVGPVKSQKKYNLVEPEALTAQQQEKFSNIKHKIYEEIKDGQTAPLPRYLAQNFNNVKNDHMRQFYGLMTRDSSGEIESVKYDRDALLTGCPPSQTKPSMKNGKKRSQAKELN